MGSALNLEKAAKYAKKWLLFFCPEALLGPGVFFLALDPRGVGQAQLELEGCSFQHFPEFLAFSGKVGWFLQNLPPWGGVGGNPHCL